MGLTLLEIQALTASLAANGRVPSTVTPPAATGTITGIIPAAGTTPTAGTGFTYTHTNTSGVYVFTFTTAFAATPAIYVTQLGATGGVAPYVDSTSTSGFTVHSNGDQAFNFTAQAVT